MPVDKLTAPCPQCIGRNLQPTRPLGYDRQGRATGHWRCDACKGTGVIAMLNGKPIRWEKAFAILDKEKEIASHDTD